MILINADEFKNKLKRYDDNDLIKVKYVRQYIDNVPAITTTRTTEGFPIVDIRPRNTGEWLDIYSSHIAYKCSCCGRQMPITDFFNYCPNCGAYMKKEAEHDSN